MYTTLVVFIIRFNWMNYKFKKSIINENSIKVERAKKNITQAQLADLVDVSRQTINAIELGKYNLSTILALKILVYLGLQLTKYFELEDKDLESK